MRLVFTSFVASLAVSLAFAASPAPSPAPAPSPTPVEDLALEFRRALSPGGFASLSVECVKGRPRCRGSRVERGVTALEREIDFAELREAFALARKLKFKLGLGLRATKPAGSPVGLSWELRRAGKVAKRGDVPVGEGEPAELERVEALVQRAVGR